MTNNHAVANTPQVFELQKSAHKKEHVQHENWLLLLLLLFILDLFFSLLFLFAFAMCAKDKSTKHFDRKKINNVYGVLNVVSLRYIRSI